MKDKELYKDTEVGRIPVDWEVKRLGEIFDITAGGDLRKDMYSKIKDDIHVYPIYSNGLDNKGLYGYSSNYDYTEEAITVTARGTIGYAIYRDHKFCAIGRVLVLKPKLKINNFFVSQYINNNIEFTIENTGVPQLTAPKISVYKIPLPPLPEQKAIARVLSDIDELIESIEKLIHKKKQIKQGAMQELLTGKKRLPGFSGEWEVKTIESFASISTGSRNTQDKVDGGKYPFFVRSSTVERINSYSYDGEAVLTAGDGVGTGKVFHYVNGKFDFHQRVYKISDFAKEVDGFYFYLYFSNNFLERIKSMTAKSSVDSVRMEMVSKMPIPLPPLPEQKAIAQILSDMDAEIEALEKKLDKYRKIKEGMMEKLLTGQVRLV